MAPVKRTLLPLWLSLCTVASLAAVDTARGQDAWFDGPAPGTDYFSGADVWGRVNPAFCGFPTFSVATDVVVLGRSTPADQTIVFDGSVNPLLDANDFGTPADAGGAADHHRDRRRDGVAAILSPQLEPPFLTDGLVDLPDELIGID